MSEDEIKEKLSSTFSLEELIEFNKEWRKTVENLKKSGADLSKIKIAKEKTDAKEK